MVTIFSASLAEADSESLNKGTGSPILKNGVQKRHLNVHFGAFFINLL